MGRRLTSWLMAGVLVLAGLVAVAAPAQQASASIADGKFTVLQWNIGAGNRQGR